MILRRRISHLLQFKQLQDLFSLSGQRSNGITVVALWRWFVTAIKDLPPPADTLQLAYAKMAFKSILYDLF
jgi:hypothetical protein